jgi:hypothetical protein
VIWRHQVGQCHDSCREENEEDLVCVGLCRACQSRTDFELACNIYSSFSLSHIYILSIVSIMTSSSPTPDLASLSLSSQSSQRLHDTYDFDGTGTGNGRPQYHYATSPPAPPSQSPFLPLSMNQSPLKSKTSRAGLPSVCPPCFSPVIIIVNIHYLHMFPSSAMARRWCHVP